MQNFSQATQLELVKGLEGAASKLCSFEACQNLCERYGTHRLHLEFQAGLAASPEQVCCTEGARRCTDAAADLLVRIIGRVEVAA
jgi:hypothetical protein